MARDWVDLVAQIEGHYPTAVGAGGQDTKLRSSLTQFANTLFKDIERARRWSLAFGTSTFTTTPGTANYTFPVTLSAMSRVYWLTDSGSPVTLENFDPQELRRIFGEGPDSSPGAPRYFAIKGTQIQLFPVPDNAGPTAGNYQILIEGYGFLAPIVETTGITTAASTTLTVPSSAYLAARGLAAIGSNVSVRGAGNLGALSFADTHVTNWTAFPLATTVTMSTPAVTAVGSPGAQVFFNSVNWLIQDFDMVVLFGVLREVAAYEKENFDVWNRRFHLAMEEMAQFDFDRKATLEKMATAVTGQRQAQLRTIGAPSGYEVRGGVIG